MNAIARHVGILLCAAAAVGCATTSEPELTPLEIREMQSRNFDQVPDVVFPSVVSVFQDLGYTIQSADRESGFISAESAAESDGWHRFWTGQARVEQTRATAFVEAVHDETSVRLNFVAVDERSSGWGQHNRDDTPILDAEPYQHAFERIEDAIFMRSD